MRFAAKIHGSVLASCAALLLAAACGDDDEKAPVKDAGTQQPSDAGTTVRDTGNDERDAEDEDPTPDAGEVDDDAGDLDGGSDDGSTPVAGDASLSTPLPADGQRLSVCYTDEDCTGDGLTCYTGAGAQPGFCTSTCMADTDCEPLAGVPTSCSPDGQCRIDCGGTPDADAGTDAGSGNGACPPSMACRDVNTSLFAPPAFRCAYLEGGGSKASNGYGRCSTAHANGDCAGELSCYVPSSGIVAGGGPGYCATDCTADTDCTDTAGSNAKPVCGTRCELDCSASGSTCPTGMNCRDIDENPLFEAYRCRFID